MLRESMNWNTEFAEPDSVVTVTGPADAPAGILKVMLSEEFTVKSVTDAPGRSIPVTPMK